MGFLVLLLLVVLLITFLPIVVAYFVYRFLSKKGYKIYGQGILILSVILVFFFWYTAFYPPDSFYEDEFETITQAKFPDSGEILIKGATYPDIHGDYSAAAIFKVSDSDFSVVLNSIKDNKQFSVDTFPFSLGQQIRDKSKNYTDENFTLVYSINPMAGGLSAFTIGFDEKNKIITFDSNNY